MKLKRQLCIPCITGFRVSYSKKVSSSSFDLNACCVGVRLLNVLSSRRSVREAEQDSQAPSKVPIASSLQYHAGVSKHSSHKNGALHKRFQGHFGMRRWLQRGVWFSAVSAQQRCIQHLLSEVPEPITEDNFDC
eukprot:2934110-Amphidinium_carterae.1